MKETLINAAEVGSGGFLGALARYGLSGLVQRQLPLSTFPYGTLSVNLLGCFAIGILAGLAESRQLLGPELRTFALIGILGGFTTFSTLPMIDDAVGEGLATVEKVEVRFYRSGE